MRFNNPPPSHLSRAVGSLLTIPAGALVELIVSGTTMSTIEGLGATLIVLGSLTFEVGGKLLKRLEQRCSRRQVATPLVISGGAGSGGGHLNTQEDSTLDEKSPLAQSM